MANENYRRIALYNGNTWPMEDVDPATYLNEALVPNFPDLRGAEWTERTDDVHQEIVFEFAKRAGQKG